MRCSPSYFNLTTDLPESAYASLVRGDIRQAHFLYAATIVRLYHGEEAVAAAEARYRSVAAGGVPENMESLTAEPGALLTEACSSEAGWRPAAARRAG